MNPEELTREIKPAIKAFMELGFPKYESQVLAILSALGTSTVKEIHQYTDVPLPKVYQTLQTLVLKRLVIQHSKTRPVQFTAYSPEIIARKIEEKNRELENNLKQGLQRLNELAMPSFAEEIFPFTSQEALIRIGRGVIANTKEQLSVAMSAQTLKLFEADLQALKERGVQLRSMIFKQFERLTPSVDRALYKALGFEHYLVDLPINLKPNLKFYRLAKKISEILDYLGIAISDAGESVILLPLFPHELFFGFWINSKQIVERQLTAYNELFALGQKG